MYDEICVQLTLYVPETVSPEIILEARGIHPMLFQCWPTVFDAGATLKTALGECPVFAGKPGVKYNTP